MMHNTELLRQNEARQAVRARLMNPPRVYRDTKEGMQIALREAQEALERMTKDRDRLKAAHKLEERYSKKLELDVADRDARILTLGQRVCELEGLGLTDSTGKRPVAEIIAEVLVNFPGVSWKEVQGIRRQRNLVIPRRLCMYEVATQRPDLSLPRIGKIFGKDHTAVLWAVAKIKAEMGDDASIARVERKKDRYKRNALAVSNSVNL